jgi:hypothetical protein
MKDQPNPEHCKELLVWWTGIAKARTIYEFTTQFLLKDAKLERQQKDSGVFVTCKRLPRGAGPAALLEQGL